MPTVTAAAVPARPQFGASQPADLTVFLLAGAIANGIAAALHYLLGRGDRQARAVIVRDIFISIIGAQAAYLLYALGWLPGSNFLYQTLGIVGALVVAFFGGLLPFVIDLLSLPTCRLPAPPRLISATPLHLSPTLALGAILRERYEIIELIGQGGMGAVYKATDQTSDRPPVCGQGDSAQPGRLSGRP